eukprot:CAMPEP_0171185248 /NCGR_PEP_ID=MMETSP0790-20130122/16204_1 /TAXON_ID=2925 /ORGANISM="Alexandrium catenella, Strain OF101" /LENGTH=81 /DNA_ID=CAMNT_0011650265 /DNA_START=17 /DNA_END=259 /DNA_ORIENTATION=+
MAGLLARAASRSVQQAAKRPQALRLSFSSLATRENPVYPSPWNKWFPHEPVPSTPKIGPYRVHCDNTTTYFYCTCGESSTQ